MELLKKTVGEHISSLAKGEYSATELCRAYLDSIEKTDTEIGAYLTVCESSALESAKKADEMIKSGCAKPLTGIPFAVKDNICTKDVPTTCASKILEDFVPPYDATAVRILKEEGAVLLGKTNMDEFAMGSTTKTSAFKVTKNPLDITRVPGGSSGGSAAAVAGNMAAFALGSDTGGSVRQPAAFCGETGFCPTYGAVSRWGLISFASSLDRIGVITKGCRDSALVLSAVMQKDPMDSTSVSSSVEGWENGDMRGLKIGVCEDFFKKGVSEGIKKAFFEAVEVFRTMGCEIVPVAIPSLSYAVYAYYIISSAEASSNLARYDGVRFSKRTKEECATLEEMYVKSRNEGFGDEVKKRIMLGTFVLSEGSFEDYYKKALGVRALLIEDFKKAFENCDIILSPTTATEAYKLSDCDRDPVTTYAEDFCCAAQSLAGLPSVTVPYTQKDKGSVGIQLTAPAFMEKRLLFAGAAFEEVMGNE